MLIIGIALHGVCYDFFFVSGQIYTDSKAGAAHKAAAQGLITLATYGLGMLVGFWAAGLIDDLYAAAGAHDWKADLAVPGRVRRGRCSVLFAAAFRNEESRAMPAEASSSVPAAPDALEHPDGGAPGADAARRARRRSGSRHRGMARVRRARSGARTSSCRRPCIPTESDVPAGGDARPGRQHARPALALRRRARRARAPRHAGDAGWGSRTSATSTTCSRPTRPCAARSTQLMLRVFDAAVLLGIDAVCGLRRPQSRA